MKRKSTYPRTSAPSAGPKRKNEQPAVSKSGTARPPKESAGSEAPLTPFYSRRKSKSITPEDAYNRTQKKARLQREHGKDEKQIPAEKPSVKKPAKPQAPVIANTTPVKPTKPAPAPRQTPRTNTSKDKAPGPEMRLNKYIAHCGIASRRAADTLIMQGHVTVNGTVVQEMGYKVKPEDIIAFKGQQVKAVDKLVYYLLNKPTNIICTSSDERGRRTVLDILATKVTERVYPVGRLDRTTSGLILLTNDGELTKKLSHPSHKVPKVYLVTLDKNLSLKDLERIREGIVLDDGEIKADSLHYADTKTKREVQIEIHSGRNRLVRRIFEHLGYEIVKLDRTYYAGLTKKNLPRGMFRPLTHEEVRMLKHFT